MDSTVETTATEMNELHLEQERARQGCAVLAAAAATKQSKEQERGCESVQAATLAEASLPK